MGTATVSGSIALGSFQGSFTQVIGGGLETVQPFTILPGKKLTVETQKAGQNLLFFALRTNAAIELIVGDDRFQVLPNSTFWRTAFGPGDKLDFKKVEIESADKTDAKIEVALLYALKK